MVKLKRREVLYADTPLVEGLYVTKGGSMLQIRLKEIQVVMSAVSTFEELVRCGKLLVERYKTVENLRRKLAESEYVNKVPEQELVRRQFDESQALESELQREWYTAVTAQPVVETEVKKDRPKRVGIKLKKVATG